jgi:arylsulfatase A
MQRRTSSNILRPCLLAAVLIASLFIVAPMTVAESPPNFLFILADDLGHYQLGSYGSNFYETPHLDRLADEGMRFSQAYAAAAVCSPTRAAIMTGKYPARLHITDFIPGDAYPHARLKTPDWQKSLPLEEITIPEALLEAGYVSGHFGKWHLNYDREHVDGRPGDPRSQGFADVLTTLKPKSEEAEAAAANPGYDAHNVFEITNRAVAFMESNRGQPFFCYVTHNAIHDPKMAYAPTVAKYAAKPNAEPEHGNDPLLAAMLEDLDASVGRLLQTLKDLGLEENTVVLFVSDNGALGGADARKPLYGDKADLYEGGIRVPLIVRWPGRIEAGAVRDTLTSSIDLFPTLLELANVNTLPESIDGVSLAPILLGRGELPERPLFWHFPHYHSGGVAPSGAIRKGPYKLIEWFERSVESPESPGAYSLFDLLADPGESKDLATSHSEVFHALREELATWRRSAGAQEMSLNPNFDLIAPTSATDRAKTSPFAGPRSCRNAYPGNGEYRPLREPTDVRGSARNPTAS